MIPKKYTSFKEIDRDLKILKLQKEIYRESLKLNFETTKTDLQPSNLLGGVGGVFKNILFTFLLNKVVKRFK